MPSTLRLPSELTIYTVGELHPKWLEWVAASRSADDAVAEIDGAAVSEVDAAGLQLLLALSHSIARQQQAVRMTNASSPLRSACDAIGLSALLASGESGEARP